ncbi:MAG: cyclic nucleotide-binding domain-containing protein [Anditalea sp.]
MRNPFRRTYTENELDLFQSLFKVQFFESLKNAEMVRFLPGIHFRKYLKDEVVFFRNDPSQALYILQKGLVTLNIDIKENFETILEVHQGEAFGENSLLKSTYRIYTAIVQSEEANLMVIPNYVIQEVFNSNPKIKAKMMTSLAEFYNSNNKRLFNSYQSSFGFFNLGQMFEQ